MSASWNLPPPPLVKTPLSAPNTVVVGSKKPKDSAYCSGRPGVALESSEIGAPSEQGSESHATWTELSSNISQSAGAEAAAERQRRRRIERNARNHSARKTGTVDFT